MYTGNLFEGRVALITGGAGTIGAATAQALANLGARVVAADATEPVALDGDGDRIKRVRLDVRDRAQIHATVQAVVRDLGRLDILVNVAGVVSMGSAEQLTEQEWDRVIDINLKGSFLCCQAVIEPMKARKFGRIVNIGSVVGKNSGNARPWRDPAEQERAGNIAYGVSKVGVHSMTGFLAKELAAHGITVNAVAPGPVASPMTTTFPPALRDLIPVGRMGQAAEIARSILFLAAPESGFITGEILDVNGGIWCD